MRLHITLEAPNQVTIPVNYQEYLTAAVYGYVGAGDADYAKFVHDEGYVADSGKHYKPFTHSWLRIPSSRRKLNGDQMVVMSGPVSWVVSSPLDDFLRPFASGLLQTGSLRIGASTLDITAVEVPAEPDADKMTKFTCLSPITVSARRADGTTQFLRPAEDAQTFSEAIRKNLISKYRAFTGSDPNETDFTLTFDAAYLQSNKGCTKKARFKGTDIIGILAPFTVTGSKELIKLGYSGGFGARNACGWGCAEVRF